MVAAKEPVSDQLLDIVLDSISEGVLVLDSNDHVVTANDAFEQIMGLPPNWRSEAVRVE